MDFSNLLSLIFFGAAFHGVTNLYQGKLEKNRDGMTKGIAEFCLGTLGFALASPLFGSAIISAIFALAFSVLAIAYMAGVFVSLKPWEEVWHVEAKLEPGDSFKPQRPALPEGKKKTSLMPISFSNVTKALNYVRRKN